MFGWGASRIYASTSGLKNHDSLFTGDNKPNNLACETGIIDDESIPGVDSIRIAPCEGMCFSEITGSEVYRGCMTKDDVIGLDYAWVFGDYGRLK